jgi:hypothetical protein
MNQGTGVLLPSDRLLIGAAGIAARTALKGAEVRTDEGDLGQRPSLRRWLDELLKLSRSREGHRHARLRKQHCKRLRHL